MPRHRIVRTSPVARSARVKQLEGMFDLPPSKRSEVSWNVELPLDQKPWQIGLIHGPSGCGKSTIAKTFFGDRLIAGFPWTEGRAIVDDFPETMGIKEITALLSSVGFSSPPAWLRPYGCLSNGEQFRVTLARALAESPDLAVIDEFTSVVDRTVARIGSAAVAKAIRARPGTRFVAVACHDDIVDWLQPDWTYEPHTGEFRWRSVQPRPRITLRIERVSVEAWGQFAHHHYLNSALKPQAECFLGTVDGRPATFAAVISSPNGVGQWRESRLVCLPDFQGVGLGQAMSAAVGSIFRGMGERYYSRTGHPAMIGHRYKSPHWRITQHATAMPTARLFTSGKNAHYRTSYGRQTAGFEYVGPALDAELARRVRRVDLTELVRSYPNRTREKYLELARIPLSLFYRWEREEIAAGRLRRLGSGRGTDRYTYRLADG